MATPIHSYEFLMEDGTMLSTEIFYDQPNDWNSSKSRLNLWLKHMYEQGEMIVGFDTEWTFKHSDIYYKIGVKVVKVALLKLCTQAGCALIKLRVTLIRDYPFLKNFLINKDTVIAGVHIKEDINNLQSDFGTYIRNAVDLSDLAETVLHQPRLTAYGVRGLASRVLLKPWKPRPFNMANADWCATPLSDEQIKCATVMHMLHTKLRKSYYLSCRSRNVFMLQREYCIQLACRCSKMVLVTF
ncbi:hypothetical protein Pint_20347 [Pistacia integerrima]|uniref:Uncharacterized protein n=1 Tax=Pistacia integerrima TaxID=434235 RepID=A0ACC0XAY0_9ROSI|nr:hypothetical protein Pint_20347 [Pistacia integerrima]